MWQGQGYAVRMQSYGDRTQPPPLVPVTYRNQQHLVFFLEEGTVLECNPFCKITAEAK